jgi:hypothetical protein
MVINGHVRRAEGPEHVGVAILLDEVDCGWHMDIVSDWRHQKVKQIMRSQVPKPVQVHEVMDEHACHPALLEIVEEGADWAQLLVQVPF